MKTGRRIIKALIIIALLIFTVGCIEGKTKPEETTAPETTLPSTTLLPTTTQAPTTKPAETEPPKAPAILTDYMIVGGGGPLKEAIAQIHPTTLEIDRIKYGTDGKSFDIGRSPDGKKIYVANEVDGKVSIINLKEMRVVGTFGVENGVRVVMITPDGKTAYIASNFKTFAYKAEEPYSMIKEVGAGGNTMAITPDGKYAFVTGMIRKGLDVIDTSTNTIIKTIELPLTEGKVGIISMVLTPDGAELWAADALSGIMYVIDVNSLSVKETIPTEEGDPNLLKDFMGSKKSFMQIVSAPDGKYIYAGGFSGNVRVFDTERYVELDPIPVNLDPTSDPTNKINGLTISPDGKVLYVSVMTKNSIGVVNIASKEVSYTIKGVNVARLVTVQTTQPKGVKIEFVPSDKKGIPEGISDAEWKSAKAVGLITEYDDSYIIKVNAIGLRPYGTYTIWWRGDGRGPLGGAPANSVFTDKDGYAKTVILVPKASMRTYNELVILYHADDKTYGIKPGMMGETSFWHMVGTVPSL